MWKWFVEEKVTYKCPRPDFLNDNMKIIELLNKPPIDDSKYEKMDLVDFYHPCNVDRRDRLEKASFINGLVSYAFDSKNMSNFKEYLENNRGINNSAENVYKYFVNNVRCEREREIVNKYDFNWRNYIDWPVIVLIIFIPMWIYKCFW